MTAVRKGKRIRKPRSEYLPQTTPDQQEEQKKYEEFWSDPCWQEPLNAQG